jgi:hypothetical protein
MGYDITFHPVGLDELEKYCANLALDSTKIEAAIAECEIQEVERKALHGYLLNLAKWQSSDPATIDFGKCFGMLSATVAGYLHPYWYTRGSAISFWVETKRPLQARPKSLTSLFPKAFSRFADGSGGLINGNYSASGFFEPQSLQEIRESIVNVRSKDSEFGGFNDEGREALGCALDYAETRGLGLIEASDIVVPVSNQVLTSADNLRARFLGHLEPAPKAPLDQTIPGEIIKELSVGSTWKLPLLALRGDFDLGIGKIHELMIGRQQSVTAVKASLSGRRLVALGVQKDPKTVNLKEVSELNPIGAFGYVLDHRELADGPIKANIKVVAAGKISEIHPTVEYISANLEVLS